MRDPKIILKILSRSTGYVDNLYRYLYIPEFYQIAYNNIHSKPSQMTPASDGSTIDGMSMDRINKLIQSIKDRSYQPTPLRRVQVPKKSGGTRPISIPSFEDKLVQEIIRMILEALYDHTFLNCSHGFRPNMSCHTALNYVKTRFTGTKWWIDMDIKGCFDNINHHKLINILAERIKEQKFLGLIWKFLKGGYIENWKYHKTYSGIPQGYIISPILANIYLDKLDKFIIDIKSKYDKGKHRSIQKEYIKLANRACKTSERIKHGIKIESNKVFLKKQVLDRNKFVKDYGYYENQDPNFRRLQYVRYADDFLIGVIASRKEAEEIMNLIKDFLKDELKLNLSSKKSKIVHNSENINFLSYDISVMKSDSYKMINGKIGLFLPYKTTINFIINNQFGKFITDFKTGKSKIKGTHIASAINDEELEILHIYNTKIRGFYNYYKMASNICKLDNFIYIIQLSFLRTLANKYKTTCAKLYKNPNYTKRKNGKTIIGITYNDKFYELFNGPFTVVKNIQYNKNIDIIENVNRYFGRTSLIDRLNANKCEYCHDTKGPFEVHHIKKLKDLKGKPTWEKFMISRKRKTMVLCKSCHDKLHAGTL